MNKQNPSLISTGEIKIGTIEFSGDINLYMFSAEAGTNYQFRGIDVEDDRLNWKLLFQDGTVIFNQIMTDNPFSYELEKAGDYTIEVSGEGTYGIEIIEILDPPGTIESEESLNPQPSPVLVTITPVLVTITSSSTNEPIGQCIINNPTPVYIREGPGESFEVIDNGLPLQEIQPLARDESAAWVQLLNEHSSAWIWTGFLSCDFDLLELTVGEIASAPTLTFTPLLDTPKPPAPTSTTAPTSTSTSIPTPIQVPTPTSTNTPVPVSGNIAQLGELNPNSGSANVLDGDLGTFWEIGHAFTLTFLWSETVTVDRIIVWDRPQDSPDNNQINRLRITLSDGQSKLFDMVSQGPRCIDVIVDSQTLIDSITLVAEDASGGNGLSEVEIWSGPKTTSLECTNVGSIP